MLSNSIAQFLGSLRAPLHLPAAIVARKRQSRSEWQLAHQAWSNAIKQLVVSRNKDSDLLARYYLHLAVCEHFLAMPDEAAAHLQLAKASPAVASLPECTLLRARLLRRASNSEALDLLRGGILQAPDDTAMLYEFASVALDGPDPAEALPIVDRLVELSPEDISFQVLATDIRERSGKWEQACERLHSHLLAYPDNIGLTERLARMAQKLGKISLIKTLVSNGVKTDPDNPAYWQLLLDTYELAGRLRQARLLCRYLIRRWPHSTWHKLKYATLLEPDSKAYAKRASRLRAMRIEARAMKAARVLVRVS